MDYSRHGLSILSDVKIAEARNACFSASAKDIALDVNVSLKPCFAFDKAIFVQLGFTT